MEEEEYGKKYFFEETIDSVKHIHNRPGWDQYFMNIARSVAYKSPCLHGRVGALIVKDKAIIATGYKGVKGGKDCVELKNCSKFSGKGRGKTIIGECRGIFAEEDAFANAEKNNAKVKGACMYVYGFRLENGKERIVNVLPPEELKETLKEKGIVKIYCMTNEGKAKQIYLS